MRFSTAKRRCQDRLNVELARVLGQDYQPRNWELLRLQPGNAWRRPRWVNFEDGQDNVVAITPIELHDRNYWVTVQSPRPLSLGQFLGLGFLSLFLGPGYKLTLWEEDPRTLPHNPVQHSVSSPQDIAALKGE